MSSLWVDGLEHYGTNTALLIAGAYKSYGEGFLSTRNPRTGTMAFASDRHGALNRTLLDFQTTAGFGHALFMYGLPEEDTGYAHYISDFSNNTLAWWGVTTDGRIQVHDFTNTVRALSGQVLVSNAYQHIETKWIMDASAGAVEIRVNGETVIDLTGQNIGGGSPASQITWGANGIDGIKFDNDDFFAWNAEGPACNDFIGDKRARLVLGQGTTITDFTVTGAATPEAAVSEIPPDGDTSYIESTTAGDIEEFTLQAVPPEVIDIATFFMIGYQRKTDSGICNLQLGVHSGASVAEGINRAVTNVYTFDGDGFDVDPNTAAPWVPSDLTNAKMRVTRVA